MTARSGSLLLVLPWSELTPTQQDDALTQVRARAPMMAEFARALDPSSCPIDPRDYRRMLTLARLDPLLCRPWYRLTPYQIAKDPRVQEFCLFAEAARRRTHDLPTLPVDLPGLQEFHQTAVHRFIVAASLYFEVAQHVVATADGPIGHTLHAAKVRVTARKLEAETALYLSVALLARAWRLVKAPFGRVQGAGCNVQGEGGTGTPVPHPAPKHPAPCTGGVADP